jgi:hypothetical protein
VEVGGGGGDVKHQGYLWNPATAWGSNFKALVASWWVEECKKVPPSTPRSEQ